MKELVLQYISLIFNLLNMFFWNLKWSLHLATNCWVQ